MKKTLFNLSFVIYLIPLISILFLGTRSLYIGNEVPLSIYLRFSANFVPFETITIYIKAIFDGSMNINIPIRNLFGNLLMFLPMGIYLPYYVKRANKRGVFIIAMFGMLLLIEVIQLITRLGIFDVDDLILNMVGALIGYGIWEMKMVQRLLRAEG